jgi:hypothetical protein
MRPQLANPLMLAAGFVPLFIFKLRRASSPASMRDSATATVIFHACNLGTTIAMVSFDGSLRSELAALLSAIEIKTEILAGGTNNERIC